MDPGKIGPEAHDSRQIGARGLWIQAKLGRRPVGPDKFGPEAHGSRLIWAEGPWVLLSPLPKADRATGSWTLFLQFLLLLGSSCASDDC